MERVVELLNEKNECLLKFRSLNEQEITNFTTGNFDNLESFYKNRDGILEIIRKIDGMIEAANQTDVSAVAVDEIAKDSIVSALNQKSELVHEILSQDLQILSLIEQAKSNIIRELSQVRAVRKAFGTSNTKGKRLDENY